MGQGRGCPWSSSACQIDVGGGKIAASPRGFLRRVTARSVYSALRARLHEQAWGLAGRTGAFDTCVAYHPSIPRSVEVLVRLRMRAIMPNTQ